MLTILFWGALYACYFNLGSTVYFEKSPMLGDHCIFIRSFQCLLFYFGKHGIFCYFILGRTKLSSFTVLLCMIRVKKKLQFFL